MKNSHRKAAMFGGLIFVLVFLSSAVPAYADKEDIKAYKKAFPDARVKCSTCHSGGMPKTGAAGLNDYGKAAIVVNSQPTAETFKELGKAEDFKR